MVIRPSHASTSKQCGYVMMIVKLWLSTKDGHSRVEKSHSLLTQQELIVSA
jgi:hypothetical protein